jgi:glutamine synthetase
VKYLRAAVIGIRLGSKSEVARVERHVPFILKSRHRPGNVGRLTVCGSLREALESLDKNRALLKHGGVFDDDFIDAYIELKMTEVERFEMTPHPVEFDMYYSL